MAQNVRLLGTFFVEFKSSVNVFNNNKDIFCTKYILKYPWFTFTVMILLSRPRGIARHRDYILCVSVWCPENVIKVFLNILYMGFQAFWTILT